FSLKYVSIPAKKCLAQRKNFSLPVTLGVFRYTLRGAVRIRRKVFGVAVACCKRLIMNLTDKTEPASRVCGRPVLLV
ncbi:MAG: hypothetical protein KH756_07270, partial [Firmicutes bacterium]|nr:hypothetical protein [Bacillota bacterium]